jgi:hypothetical protein
MPRMAFSFQAEIREDGQHNDRKQREMKGQSAIKEIPVVVFRSPICLTARPNSAVLGSSWILEA